MDINFLDTQKAIKKVINKGDHVLVHSSLNRMGNFINGPDSIINCLKDAVGSGGTIIMITHTFSFSKTKKFSIDSPSESGVLSEFFRKYPNVKRSCTPMVSFCALGRLDNYFTQPFNSHLDETATLSRLLVMDGKILLMGIGFKKCTLYHLSEERLLSPHNFYKTFEGGFYKSGKFVRPISQRYFVRKDVNLKKNGANVQSIIENKNLDKKTKLGRVYLRSFKARDFDNICMNELKNNQDFFLEK